MILIRFSMMSFIDVPSTFYSEVKVVFILYVTRAGMFELMTNVQNL
jgi:hypothetical protein